MAPGNEPVHDQALGGYYSSYDQNGAIPGFQFANQADAETFQEKNQPDSGACCQSKNKAPKPFCHCLPPPPRCAPRWKPLPVTGSYKT